MLAEFNHEALPHVPLMRALADHMCQLVERFVSERLRAEPTVASAELGGRSGLRHHAGWMRAECSQRASLEQPPSNDSGLESKYFAHEVTSWWKLACAVSHVLYN